ncbi:MAG: DUF2244 domain-containing protein [Hyphomicrobium sp.]|mgnify:CR=1 FL=1|jgi:uncharacterized membrane protein|nr:DUF2244 domain-containing protein [Hyphomicrobium sp.]PPD08108.1 MAG: hypothetical protein CTY28_07510 [Hyphomicrobium sp.]
MTDTMAPTQGTGTFRAILHPHRSLSQSGFLILLGFIGFVSAATGIAFYMMGAWPVLGFYGLDVLAIYVAFKINYRAGKAYELVELSPDVLKITQVHQSGRSRSFDFNPYWVKVLLNEWPDGSADLKLALHGNEFEIARFLNTDEKKDFAAALRNALSLARATPAALA